ncbi:unnamed protein product [Ambrosiozyma monospora]|uniref:Unnamed protein product n=1 Tax=Ambrosiozyma monospora TaxID=43982 RepID=A0ACB5SXM8_AMBMO|nr:unnamed protein product [Ambrosiozyma monospora]
METDTPVDMKWINNISGLNILSISFLQESDFNIELNLQNLHSLKSLDLFDFFVDAPIFNNIPDTIESFDFEMKASGGSSIKLPLHLQKLVIRSNEIPRISNVKDLKNLMDVKIITGISGQLPLAGDAEQIQVSIDRLPSTITNLDITEESRIKKQHLSLGNFPVLETLSIGSCSFDSSRLTSLRSLHVSASSFTIGEHLPLPSTLRSFVIVFETQDPINFDFFIYSPSLSDTLESLVISFASNSTKLPSKFWHDFILPLESLLELTLQIPVLSSDLIVDEFPPCLASLNMTVNVSCVSYKLGGGLVSEKCGGKVVLHGFDKSLKYFYLDGCGKASIKQV